MPMNTFLNNAKQSKVTVQPRNLLGFHRGRDDTQTEKQPRFGKANGIFIGHKGEEEEFDSWDREGETLGQGWRTQQRH